MSANHDIKSQPPAAHFTTILCTKSQQSRFVALPRQLPHLKKFKSLTEGEGGRACNIVSHLRFCGLLLRPKQPSSLNWQVFIRWHILTLVSILRRWRKRRCSIGNSILGRPPPSHPSRAVVGHQPICHLLPPTIPPQASSRSPCPCATVVWSCPALGWISIIKNQPIAQAHGLWAGLGIWQKGIELLRQVTPKPRFPHPPDLSGGERRHVCNLWKSPSDYRWIIVRSKTMIEAQ